MTFLIRNIKSHSDPVLKMTLHVLPGTIIIVFKKQKPENTALTVFPAFAARYSPFAKNGIDGNRTRVQRPLHRTSTSVVFAFTFPPRHPQRHGCRFSSFIIRLYTQSLVYIVSYIVDAWVLMCRCTRSDNCH